MSEHDHDPLFDELAEALRPPEHDPPPERVTALREAAERAADEAGRRSPDPGAPRAAERPAQPRWRRWGLGGAVAVALAGAALVVANLISDDDPIGGNVEYAGTISGPAGSGELDVTMTGIGRVIELDTDDLEILPKGEFYEVWFVGPGDSRESPNRISAGTFHPDTEGRSNVTLAAAVDPALYPTVVITSEPGNGNPAAAGRAVLQTKIGD